MQAETIIVESSQHSPDSKTLSAKKLWFCFLTLFFLSIGSSTSNVFAFEKEMEDVEFFERRIRPLLVKHCYECHSEQEKEQMGGLLLDRRSGWIKGGDTTSAVIPGEVDSSLLIDAIRYENEDLQMPPDGKLSEPEIKLFEQWVHRGAPGPLKDMGESEFSQLGDQDLLFEQAADHWAFQPISKPTPPEVENALWNRKPIDQFLFAAMQKENLSPARPSDPRSLLRRLSYDLTGLPPSHQEVSAFPAQLRENRQKAIRATIDRLIDSPEFGEHFARMWLDVARYADTDSTYRPDTKTPHYYPFAFTYRDYVIEAFNTDKPFDLFVKEQLAADLMGYASDAPQHAALGFLAVGPHARAAAQEELDDWIDLTSRGLLGLTVACARCHDHKYEPIPTADYYALYGVFASVDRVKPLSEKGLPLLASYKPSAAQEKEYLAQRKVIEKKIKDAGNKTSGGNNRSVAQKIQETELAELLLFHPAAPARAMIVKEKKQPVEPAVFIRGEPSNRGERIPRRFLKILDEKQSPFPAKVSGRLQLAEKIVDPQNPLTARVFVNRVWGRLMGSYLVESPSNFGLQSIPPTHPELLDWLANDFIENGWSIKHLVRTIVLTSAYQQSSLVDANHVELDPQNTFLSRANRKHLSIEQLRDSMLITGGRLDSTRRGHPAPLWGEDYSLRRAIYGYVNRFNLDPTLRAFDFPTPMQSQPRRTESIVATQNLFVLNSPFVLDQAVAITTSEAFQQLSNTRNRTTHLFRKTLQRNPTPPEYTKIERFLESQERFAKSDSKRPPAAQHWALIAQSILMSNEFQYID